MSDHKWEKLGRIYEPDKTKDWSQFYGILPTPLVDSRTGLIHVFFAATDKDRFGRIARLSVDIDDPTRIIEQPTEPVLDIGNAGTFDDCGVNPSSVHIVDGELWVYYVGYQRSVRVPYLLLAGLARGSLSALRRNSVVPMLERTKEEPWIRAAPTILREGDSWRMWYVSASGWKQHSDGIFRGRLMPEYNLRCAESKDGIHWTPTGADILERHSDEFGFGRPWVTRYQGRYRMWYSIRRETKSYRIGYAESVDGDNWTRMDDKAGIDVSLEGWDSEMICYPAVVSIGETEYLFYNGNNNGVTGFGVARRTMRAR